MYKDGNQRHSKSMETKFYSILKKSNYMSYFVVYFALKHDYTSVTNIAFSARARARV